MANTDDLDLANDVAHRLSRHAQALTTDVPALIATAAYSLAGARMMAALATSATDGSPARVRDTIGDEQQDLVLRASFDNCLRSAATALDVCAAAIFRLGGGVPNPFEASLGQWAKYAPRCPSLELAFEEWVNDTRASSGWKALNVARNEVTHSWSEHSVAVGEDQLLVDVEYGGQSLPVKDACNEICRVGTERFRNLVTRFQAAYP